MDTLLKLKLLFKKRTLFENTILNCCASFIFFILLILQFVFSNFEKHMIN